MPVFADSDALRTEVDGERELPGKLESLDPGLAKARLTALLAPFDPEDRHLKRRELAHRADLDVLQRTCPSFGRFRRPLRDAMV